MAAQIHLVGLAHDDLFLEEDIRNTLFALRPDAITHESHEDIVNEFERIRSQKEEIEEAIHISPYTPSQKEALRRIIIDPRLPRDYHITKTWAAQAGIPFYSIDSNAHLEQVSHDIQGVGTSWSVLSGVLREQEVDEISMMKKILEEVESVGLDQTLRKINGEVNNYYSAFSNHFSGERLSDEIMFWLEIGREARIVGQRDAEQAAHLTELSRKYTRIVHIGGLQHMVAEHGTLYWHIKPLEPTRATIRDYLQ